MFYMFESITLFFFVSSVTLMGTSSDTVDTTVYNQQTGGKPNNNAAKPKTTLATASGSSESDNSSSSSSDEMSAPNQSRDDMPTNEYEGASDKKPSVALAKLEPAANSSSDDSESDSDSSSSNSSVSKGVKRTDYSNLNVSREIEDLFDFIGTYEPVKTELDTKLKPFFPDYIPSIGSPDVFLKMPR